ncbi:hypothetical protein ACFFGH_01670 [Lysobacter korlensis]|uniref:Uncharacterized protein n=1 Tax=Lysobacter korlensis TaxID=553636 RepID=A0ABV6RHV6_9GAMM
MKLLIRLAAAIVLLCGGLPAAAQDWPSVPVPADAAGYWVTEHMLYNGLNMRASRFEIAQPLAKVEAFYRDAWGARMARTPWRNKTILGRAEGRHYITVELTPAGNATRGQIGVMEIPREAPRTPPGSGFPMPSQTKVSEDIVYLDTPQRTRTLNMENAFSPLQNAQFYSRTMKARGYVPERGSTPCTAASDQCISFYSRHDAKLMLSFKRVASGSNLVAVQSR